MFRSRGVYLVLFWTASCLLPYYQIAKFGVVNETYSLEITVLTNAAIIIYPILGWMADVHYGRHKVIRWSLRVMWVVSLLQCFSHVLQKLQITTGYAGYITALRTLLNILISVAVGGVLCNIILLGVDQLTDAPSFKITSFLRWCGWLWLLADFASSFTRACNCQDYELVYHLQTPVLLTVAICLDFFFSHTLLEGPTFSNPLTVTYKVLKYAWKNKYPRLPSTYTLWDGKLSSRIDLAKTKFGGPFTTVQVEDVKSLGHIVLLLCSGSIIVTLIFYINDAKGYAFLNLQDTEYSGTGLNKDCLWRITLQNFGALFVVVTIPVYEVFVIPFLYRCLNVKFFFQILMGILLLATSACVLGILEIVGYYQSHQSNKTCLLDLKSFNKDSVVPLSFNWFILPDVFLGVSKYILLISAAEFICAQSPSSMKGFVFGLAFTIGGISLLLNLAWLMPLQNLIKKRVASGICGIVYFFILVGISVGVACLFYGTSKCYKNRERNEDKDDDEVKEIPFLKYKHNYPAEQM